MQSLEEYLAQERPADQRDVTEIEQLLEEVAQVYLTTFKEKTAWPYELDSKKPDAGGPASSEQPSHSTTAMILAALLRLTGAYSSKRVPIRANVFPLRFRDNKLVTQIQAVSESAAVLLLDSVFQNGKVESTSGTFGKNDIFTLMWLVESATADWSDNLKDRWSKVCDSVKDEVDTKKKKFLAPGSAQDPSVLSTLALLRRQTKRSNVWGSRCRTLSLYSGLCISFEG